ncbi:HMG1/2-like protein [Tanacetum coccineum]|uniref:HMG1/2-like protein n=1 Tax=Tanacetum coccineum TaxID=301880 RepID=A0ABQ5INV9_9ASTR
MRGRLPRLRDRAHVQRLGTSGNKGQLFVLVRSKKYYVLSFSSEPCLDHRKLEFFRGSRLRFGWTSLCIGRFHYGIPSGLYANEHFRSVVCTTSEARLQPYGILFVLLHSKCDDFVVMEGEKVRCFDPLFVFSFAFVMPRLNIANAACTVTREEYTGFIDNFHIPSCYDLVLPDSHHTALDVPSGYVVLYISLYTVGNFRLPFDKFFLKVLDFFRCHISFLNLFGAVRLSSFAVACRTYGGELTLFLFMFLCTFRLAVKKREAPAAKKAPAKKAKEAKDPNKPKRPASAFFVFMEDFRKQYKEKHPNNKSVSVVSIYP